MTERERNVFIRQKNDCYLPYWARRCRRFNLKIFVLKPDGHKQYIDTISTTRRLAAQEQFLYRTYIQKIIARSTCWNSMNIS